jgi:hypothetical protein
MVSLIESFLLLVFKFSFKAAQYKSIPSGAHYVTLQKIFLTSKLSYLFIYFNPTHKTEAVK